jgi:serine/threonine protein kinase
MPISSRKDYDPTPRQLYEAFLGRGESADFLDLCENYPQYAEELRELHGEQQTVAQRLVSSVASRNHQPGSATTIAPEVTRYGRRHRLGRGGMGVVYDVWDKLLRRHLAMKIVRQQDAQGSDAPVDPHVVARFVREAEITARLDHPGVVPIHDLGVDESGHVFFTMRLIQGQSLAAVIKQARQGLDRWSQTRVVEVIVKVCDTVAFAHTRGVTHRDLKPDNIMIGAFGETYVVDWGLPNWPARLPTTRPLPTA